MTSRQSGSLLGCNNDLIPSPSYSWRGRILDSITGAPVDHTVLSIQERASEPSDTSLTLHLKITDPLGRYRPAAHQNTWLLNCDGSPKAAPEPFPTEDSLKVLLQPNP
jgi:hypothetical protein